jgi:hypothetical protein
VYNNHCGGITFTVDTLQEAARCMNLGIYLGGRKHRVFSFTRSRADDLCYNCSVWGHLERSCCASPRCGICSEHHRTDHHPNARTGNQKTKCPNCNGNNRVDHSCCPVQARAIEQENNQRQDTTSGKDQRSKAGYGLQTRVNSAEQLRRAPRSSRPGRQ